MSTQTQNIPAVLTEFMVQFGDLNINGETTTFTNLDLLAFFADRDLEVVDEATKTKTKKARKPRTKRDPLMPVKPKSGMALYFEQTSVNVANELTAEGELTECSAVLTGLREGWKELAKEQVDEYKDEAAKNREQWKRDMESWYDEHPEDRPAPKAPKAPKSRALTGPKASTKFDANQDPEAPEGWSKGVGFIKGVPLVPGADKAKAIIFKSFEEAVAKAEELGDACGGITRTKTGFALRKGNEIKGIDFSKDEISWIKTKCKITFTAIPDRFIY